MSDRETILVVGAGIGGLAAARALSRVGRRVRLVEQAPEIREIGAGLQLGPNGFRMMEALGLRDAVDDLAVFPDDLIMMDGVTAKEVTRVPVGAEFRARFGHPYAVIHRADLHGVLLRVCQADPSIEITTGATITKYDHDSHGVVVTAADGRRIEAAALVGADGLWSPIRQTIIGDGPPRVSGHIAYRAVLPIEQVEERFRRNAMILWAGPRNHLVQYPLRGGKLFNLVAVFHSDKYVEGWDRQGDPTELHARFAENCEVVRALLAKVETWRMWVLCDREPKKHWSQGRAVLVGDAAHPMLQYLAQGAGMALEDAVALAAAVSRNGDDYPAAFAEYASERYLRTGRCQIMARLYGAFFHATDVTRELATGFLSSRTPQQSYESLAWLYDHDAGARLALDKPGGTP